MPGGKRASDWPACLNDAGTPSAPPSQSSLLSKAQQQLLEGLCLIFEVDLQENRARFLEKSGTSKFMEFAPALLVHLSDGPLPHRVRISHEHPDVPVAAY